jgi:hypothetical protein
VEGINDLHRLLWCKFPQAGFFDSNQGVSPPCITGLVDGTKAPNANLANDRVAILKEGTRNKIC